MPRHRRGIVARQTLAEVALAARHLQETGHAHPHFGDGSLMARCHQMHAGLEAFADDPDFLHALGTVTKALLQNYRM